MEMRSKLVRLMLSDLSSLRFAWGLLAIMFGLSLTRPDVLEQSYMELRTMADSWVWSAVFAAYGFSKIATSICRTHRYTGLVISLCGLFLWCFVLLSLLYAHHIFGPTEVIILTLIFGEVWMAASALIEEHK